MNTYYAVFLKSTSAELDHALVRVTAASQSDAILAAFQAAGRRVSVSSHLVEYVEYVGTDADAAAKLGLLAQARGELEDLDNTVVREQLRRAQAAGLYDMNTLDEEFGGDPWDGGGHAAARDRCAS